ncbi:MAG: hypothetical protein A3B10_01160 [Candidatus Doudnabacteria bacterium RIFCSPLOWO2_01_FULL_44_21]|uniref:DUF4012 domain-containing protein n=1 Tax=Candidatus Doudnabacteria bacterium RIFCSPLOWO2_01_FULL_44_21 TaxID=1817841 RepID=A0A1F5PWU0_9BACT|nr:MAG: hypothetical protein A3B95_04070 [Candidatus Doudnabacteria bacterium RIFCSPHIGHO2_02_FULL_43_13b]OGE94395.1 MAG: hypothetical protein A3B10_01160 [Candidatus Doudnabacteria bacterium RIFCSPLOWO2_01_FULL_44_21]
MKKFSKIDIGYLKRKDSSTTKSKPVLIKSKVRHSQSDFWRSLSFAVSGITIILIIQSVLYLSSAKSAVPKILGSATSAYNNLNSANESLGSQDFSSAEKLFDQAENNIQQAQDQLNDFKILQFLTPQANTARHVLLGASFLAEAGGKLTQALRIFDELKISSSGVETEGFNEKISSNKTLLEASFALINKAAGEFESVGNIPLDYAQTFEEAETQIGELRSILENLIGLEDLYLNLFFGVKTYFLAFQNSNEARATGGFIGTYGVLKIADGQINTLKINSIYQLDGNIHEQIAAPGPFQPQIKKWATRDANWFADFRTSASKLLYFFEKGGETADGVLAMTPKLFEDLLSLVGPIEMPKYSVVLTAENFQEVVQYKTSTDYDRVQNQPKKLLDDFAPLLLDRLMKLSGDEWLRVFEILSENLISRQIMIFTTNPQTQALVEKLGYSGAVLPADYDYLMINNSNLGGTKTDLKVRQTAQLGGKILSDGSIINTLQVSRINASDATNRNYLRVLVPLGSQFVSATGFDEYSYYKSEVAGMRSDPDLIAWDLGKLSSNTLVHTEADKTEFSGFVSTQSGETSLVTLTYILPFKVDLTYSLLLQKQSGSQSLEFIGTLDLGEFRTKWKSTGVESNSAVAAFESNTSTDDFWALILK